MSRIILISCVSKKLTKRAAAKDLYVSPLFTMNMAYAKTLKSKKIFILSAKYGLLETDQIIFPYNETLNTKKVDEIKHWAEKVLKQMHGKINFKHDEIIFLAGKRYRKFLMPHFAHTHIPMKGLGIGKQLQFLKKKIHAK